MLEIDCSYRLSSEVTPKLSASEEGGSAMNHLSDFLQSLLAWIGFGSLVILGVVWLECYLSEHEEAWRDVRRHLWYH